MNIRWNSLLSRFEAEFTPDFQGDLLAVKAAGFKADTSSGSWVWWTAKVKVLQKLKPASGRTMTEQAFAIYEPMAKIEEQNAATRKQFAAVQKAAKKIPAPETPNDKMWIGPEDLPPAPPYKPAAIVCTAVPTGTCAGCGDPTYLYELPEACLWCEKNLVLDNPFHFCHTGHSIGDGSASESAPNGS
jgi:hypothetical protein